MMDPKDKEEINKMIDLATRQSYSKRVGDTPTDALQLVPKKYMDSSISSVVSSVFSTISSLASAVSSAISALSASVLSGTQLFSSTSVVGVSLGFRPNNITIFAVGGENAWMSVSSGGWSSIAGNNCVYQFAALDSSNLTNGTGASAWFTGKVGSNTHTGMVTNITSTGFVLSNVKANTPANVTIMWTAEER